jgi:hypothetical protein
LLENGLREIRGKQLAPTCARGYPVSSFS